MKNVLKVVFAIIGTLIGAGFASGKEIYLFFTQYGINGIWGILVASIISGLVIATTFTILNKNKIANYQELLEKISSKKAVTKTTNIIVNCFLLISFFIMVAGFSAYFKQEFQIPIFVTATIMAVMCYITFKNGIEGIIKVNAVLIPIMIVFIVYICFLYFSKFQFDNIVIRTNNNLQWLFNSILYASYNSILLIPILIGLKQYIKTEKQISITASLCTIIIFLLGLGLTYLLSNATPQIAILELPLIQIVKSCGNMYMYFYSFIIIAAIFTSAISAGYGFLENIINPKIKNKLLLLICITSILVAYLGFGNLVNILYPFFGVLGIIQILLLILHKNVNK